MEIASVGNCTAKAKVEELQWHQLLQVPCHNTSTNCRTTQTSR